jgi:hypothetical protein
VQAGFVEQAVQTTEKIYTTYRQEYLPAIATALAEASDKENFKRLLIPCASYLDSACRMCGLLARLYPEQAAEVAKVVSKSR